MSTIRKQALTGSAVIYIGFAIGALNTYLFTKQGLFTTAEYGLTKLFIDFGEMMAVLGGLGTSAAIYKFYPYYRSNLEKKEIDLITWCMLLATAGTVLVICGGFIFKDFFIDKFKNSPLIIPFYKWLFPFAIGLLFFKVVENFCLVIYKSVVSNFFKEVAFRLYTTVLILLYWSGLLSFETFVYIYSFAFILIFLLLLIYLIQTKQLYFSFKLSRVTKKFYKKIVTLQGFVLGGQLVITAGGVIDTIFIAAMLPNGLALAGIYTFSQYGASIMDAPRRSLTAVAIGNLSQAWKDKNIDEIKRIYTRSCINMMLFALLVYGLMVLNLKGVIEVANINSDFTSAFMLVILLGASRIIDAGTGVNAQIIGTSNFWRFEFITGIVMLAIRLPLVYFFIKKFGLLGPAYAELIALAVYNFIRTEFLRRKFNMQPFTIKTVYALLLAGVAFTAAHFAGSSLSVWFAIIVKSVVFVTIMIAGMFYLHLSPDVMQLYDKFIRKRFRK